MTMNVLASKIVFILKCHSDLQIKCGDQSDNPIANLSLTGPFPERISNIKQISTLCNEQIGFFFSFSENVFVQLSHQVSWVVH